MLKEHVSYLVCPLCHNFLELKILQKFPDGKRIEEGIPSVVHIDNTTRPQILEKSYNKEFYEVVKGMGGIVLNTSLNLAGDPMNLTPEDALLSFKYSEMDALVIGDFLVKK